MEMNVIQFEYLESSKKQHKKMTVQECLEIGGHCWRYDDGVLLTNPPRRKRCCEHCGTVQIGTPQSDMRWEDWR